jgi:uncharacterized protein (UPF0305 family)
MEKQTQLKMIKNKLLKTGYVSRNWCLRRYISRLSARILDLKNAGYNIIGDHERTKNGLDYIYRLGVQNAGRGHKKDSRSF